MKPILTVGSMCSGYGGLELALRLAGVEHRLAWVADSNDAAKAVLAHRYPNLPNLGDITIVDWSAVEPVEAILAGYPCQGFSVAGQRKGAEDERFIWPSVADAVRVLRPRFVLLENVAGHRSLGFGRVLADLAAMRYVGSWVSVRASDVGAAHKRERVFIAAWSADTEGFRHFKTPTAQLAINGGSQHPDKRKAGGHGPTLADQIEHLLPTPTATPYGSNQSPSPGAAVRPSLDGLMRLLPTPTAVHHARNATADRRDPKPTTCTTSWTLADVAHADRWGQYAPAIARWEHLLGRPAPEPTEPGKTGPRLSPRFVEWLMGLPDGWVCDVPGLSRNDRLRLLGNGVVPQQGAHALYLTSRPRDAAATWV